MKTLLAMVIAAGILFWFADATIQGIGLMTWNGEKWATTHFVGWKVFVGSWVLFLTVSAAVALLVVGLVAWLRFDFESREKELKEELAKDKHEAIAELEKIHASQIENLFLQQTNRSKHLENAYADVEKYRRMLASQEDENARLVQRMKGKDAVIMRLNRKIKHLTSSF